MEGRSCKREAESGYHERAAAVRGNPAVLLSLLFKGATEGFLCIFEKEAFS